MDFKKNLADATKSVVFRMERDAILRSLDVVALDHFFKKWKQPTPKSITPMQLMHYTRLQLDTFTYEEKLTSAKWIADVGLPLPKGFELVDNQLGDRMLTGHGPCL
jgi:hypothetical protein